MLRITLLTNPDVCNLQCTLCFLRQQGTPYGKGEMPWEIAERAIRQYAAQGIREVIPSTMGEPLLYSSFEKLERLIQKLHLKLNLTTNGTFPRKGVCLWAQELLPISSDIKISCWGTEQQTLDSLCPGINVDSYRSNLEKLLEIRQKMSQSVERLSRISLQMAVCKTNRQEVMNVLEMAEELGVDRVKLNRAVFLSTANDLQKKEAVSPEDFLNRKEFQNSSLVVEGTFLYPKSAMSRAKCPFPGKELWILPDGSTEPCPDPENRFVHPMSSKNRCENCHLFSPDRH